MVELCRRTGVGRAWAADVDEWRSRSHSRCAALSTRRAFRRPLNDPASGGAKSGPAGREGRETTTTTTTSLLLHDNIPMATRRAPNTKQSIVNVGDSPARSSSPPTLQLSGCSIADLPSVRFVCTLLSASLAHASSKAQDSLPVRLDGTTLPPPYTPSLKY